MYFTSDLISVLCPTRMRPENVIKLISTARSTANRPELIEFIFYVDNDDDSFPDISNVKVIRGPRIWISNAHNVIYTEAQGEILMTAGDDMEFLTSNWDEAIRSKFQAIPDRIGLVFGNDLGTHAGKIAVHGFFHQSWVSALGTWVQPGRGSLWDLWSTDVAKKLHRFFYLPDVHIKHVHYRQGKKEAVFDATYKHVYASNSAFSPQITYKLLARERRIDRILLAEVMNPKPPIEINYLLSSLCLFLMKEKLHLALRRKLQTLTNIQVILLPYRIILMRITRLKRFR